MRTRMGKKGKRVIKKQEVKGSKEEESIGRKRNSGGKAESEGIKTD